MFAGHADSCCRGAKWPARTLLLLVAWILGGCATGAPPAGLLGSPSAHRLTPPFAAQARPPRPAADSTRTKAPGEEAPAPHEDDDPEDDFDEEWSAPDAVADVPGGASGSRAGHPALEEAPLEDGEEGPVGWRDGVGDGHPWPVPFSLDHFQGLLGQVGVPQEVLPRDGRTLSPEQAMQLLGHLLDAEAGLVEFPRQRMAAHLLLEVATGDGPVTREALHARMDRFHRLRVVRPDGYVVRVVTGEAVQRAGEVRLAEDGTLRAGRYEVGPFYAVEASRAFQHKVTKAPAGWVYRVWRNGERADFDGFDAGVLQETKGLGYDKHFDAKLNAKQYFKGAEKLARQAARQWRVSNGTPIRWHVAEPRMVAILKKLFKEKGITGIDVVFTPPP